MLFRSILMYLLVKGSASVAKTLLNGKRSRPDRVVEEKEILILGNGPSLNELDLFALREKLDFACVNWFAVQSSLFRKLKPCYYVLIDGDFFVKEEMLSEKKRDSRNRLFNEFNMIDWSMVVITPQKYRIEINNPYITYEAVSTGRLYNDYLYKFMNFLYSKNLAVCGLQNVVVGALHYFIMKKFKTIYMAGVDMSEFQVYKVDGRNHVLAEYTHFYGIDYVDCTETGSIPQGEFSRWMGYYVRMLKEFYCMSQFAAYQSVKVINLSENSFIDVFEKQDWKELIDG